MKEIITFCQRERLILLIDDLYYTTQDHSIHSRRLSSHWNIKEFGLFLFNSISKCLIGDCEEKRVRKYFERTGIDLTVVDTKTASMNLCPNIDISSDGVKLSIICTRKNVTNL